MKTTVKGMVVSVPTDAKQSRIAIQQGEKEYRIIPKAAGIDLEDEINVSVEATGELIVDDDVQYLVVRKYTVLEDDAWE
ncbi:MAG: hypothetical protein IJS54_03215 [Desulfovibrio sp.]|nr:hypothetical protein [Desulfovibrio sp.]